MFYEKIDYFELELTTRCNAACPQCGRNYYGGRTWPTLPLVDLDLELVKPRLLPWLDKISHVKLCGTYGDPCLHRDLIDFVIWLRDNSRCDITINTNGSLRNQAWWKSLGRELGSRGKVYWGIDGLEDTHHLHRRGTNFQKILRNLSAFNSAGGVSVWSFLVFEHNQHQVEQARQLSQDLGCQHFAIKSTSRFVNKQHQLVPETPVMDRKNRVIYWLKPTTDQRYVNQGYQEISHISNYAQHLETAGIACLAQKIGMVYVTAQGYVLPCGFLLDRLYGYEAEQHTDHDRLLTMIGAPQGFDAISIYKHSIQDIIDGAFFQRVRHSWSGTDRLERCAHQCGAGHTLLRHANKDLAKVWSGISIVDLQK